VGFLLGVGVDKHKALEAYGGLEVLVEAVVVEVRVETVMEVLVEVEQPTQEVVVEEVLVVQHLELMELLVEAEL
jgi:hypothetical protein